MRLVLLRHGESEYNKANKFTGWTDVGLTDLGVKQAKEAGVLLKKEGFVFDVAYTSVLKRAIQTLQLCLSAMGQEVRTFKTWRLNEKHYGALQGKSKSQVAKLKGEEQVLIWRRSYDVAPPPMDPNDYLVQKAQFDGVIETEFPRTECLKDVVARVEPYWKEKIVPDILSEKKVIISAHGNSLRALVKIIENISDQDIVNLNIPVGIPLVYELQGMRPVTHYYLGDQEKVKQMIEEVKSQGKAA